MEEERFDDFPIYELQDDWPLINQRDIGTQGRHEGCVLETYDTGANHDDLFRQTNQVGKVVCIDNAVVVKGDAWAVSGSRATSNEYLLRFDSKIGRASCRERV